MRNNLEALEARRLLSAGDLDPTFGTGGKAITPFPQNLLISDSAVLADDKIVLAGDAPGADGIQVYFFRRLNADGSVDTSFGNQGDATGEFQAGKDALIFSALVQPDGSALALGDSGGTPNLARFNPDGTLDTTFNGTGFVDLSDIGGTLGVQSDGKILVTGRNGLTRFNADGSIDTTFGTAGTTTSYVKQDTGDNISSSLNVGVIKEQPDGKLLLGGGIQEHHNDRFAMSRLNADGSLDTTFGSGGMVKTPTTSVPPIVDGIQDLAVLGNGQILAGGTGDQTVELVRYNADGTVDHTFANPAVFIPFGTSIETLKLAMDGQGNAVLIGGGINDGIAVARVTPNGTVDASMGAVIGDDDSQRSLFITGGGLQSDGKIVLAGDEVLTNAQGDARDTCFAVRLLATDATTAAVTLDSGSKTLTIDGTSGNDRVQVDEFEGTLRAELNGFGRAFEVSDTTSISVTGNAGNDLITTDVQSVPALISGGAGRDKITGGDQNDTLFGDAGRDFIDGGSGMDLINGGEGNDQLRGQDGSDRIYGRAGNDYLEGDGGNDRLTGDAGTDVLHGNAGNDTLFTNDGEADSLFGDGGSDTSFADNMDLLKSIEMPM